MDEKVIKKNMQIMNRFTQVYCNAHHGTKKGTLCKECADLLKYAERKLELCPLHPKPKCKDCKTHCYKPDSRAKVREIMKYSGIYFVKRGRIDWAIKYFL